MDIVFTKHALDKFVVLQRHAFPVSKEQVLATMREPELIDQSRQPLLIAQKSIDLEHVLRVVYKQENEVKIIITFYPGRKNHYDKK